MSAAIGIVGRGRGVKGGSVGRGVIDRGSGGMSVAVASGVSVGGGVAVGDLSGISGTVGYTTTVEVTDNGVSLIVRTMLDG